ncbi:glycine N-acyltransferase-like [Liolophura sinensis]|uniref:glycine N-acyltransferase-like n=1 Tax=Liolophura sinensis TaxID=3198878 RepID=UPI0031593268
MTPARLERAELPELACYLTQQLPSGIKDDYLSHEYDVFAVDQSALKAILDDNDVITWTRPVEFPCVSEASCSTIKELAGRHGWNVNTYGPQWTEMYCVERENLKLINPPKGITVAELSSKDAEVVNSRWKFNSGRQSMSVFKFWIENYPSVALFDAEGQLVAWELTTHFGIMGRLYVMPEHRGKGYAKYIISTLAQKCFAKDIKPVANLELCNYRSIRLHQKMGFTKVSSSPLTFIKTEKKNCAS